MDFFLRPEGEIKVRNNIREMVDDLEFFKNFRNWLKKEAKAKRKA